jgi:hypothetical protein
MQRWTPKAAARLGFLAGKGASFDMIMADRLIRSRSAQSVSKTATQWKLPLGSGGAPAPTLAVPVTARDEEALQAAAAARGLSPASFVATLVHIAVCERLFRAIMDDDHD